MNQFCSNIFNNGQVSYQVLITSLRNQQSKKQKK
jgi:hypothetical protein